MTKRYLLFAGYERYPAGGWRDKKGECATIQEAQKIIAMFGRELPSWGWWHIVDLDTGLIVKSRR